MPKPTQFQVVASCKKHYSSPSLPAYTTHCSSLSPGGSRSNNVAFRDDVPRISFSAMFDSHAGAETAWPIVRRCAETACSRRVPPPIRRYPRAMADWPEYNHCNEQTNGVAISPEKPKKTEAYNQF